MPQSEVAGAVMGSVSVDCWSPIPGNTLPDCRRCITGDRIRELEESINRLHDLLDAEHAARLGRPIRQVSRSAKDDIRGS